MPSYVLLMNLTERGFESITPAEEGEGAELSMFQDAVAARVADLGGELSQLYWTLGGYDVVAIPQLGSDAAAAAVALWLGQTRGVQTTTLPAFAKEEVSPSEAGTSVFDYVYRCHFGADYVGG